MKNTLPLALLIVLVLALPSATLAAGTARVRVSNTGHSPLSLTDGRVVAPGTSLVVEVPAGVSGALAGVDYPALRPGSMYSIRLSPDYAALAAPASMASDQATTSSGIALARSPSSSSNPLSPLSRNAAGRNSPGFCPAPVPAADDREPALPERSSFQKASELVKGTVDAVDVELDCVEVTDKTLGVAQYIYNHISGTFTPAQRAAAMAKADRLNPRNFWMPRSASTWFGSFDRVVNSWKKVSNVAETANNTLIIGKIGTVVVQGGMAGKSVSQIIDDLADSGIETAKVWGELAYWTAAIGTGVVHGRSVVDSIVDGFDEKHAGIWTKIGFHTVNFTTETILGLKALLKADEQRKLNESLVASVRAAGYGDEAEKALRAWLALDWEEQLRTPFSLKDEWLVSGGVCEAEEKHPCIPCWMGDLVGVCSDPNCPNNGQPHCKYKGGGTPAFGRAAAKPKTSQPLKTASESDQASDTHDWTGRPIPKSDLDAINSLNDF